MHDALQEQLVAFRKKFGREPGPSDPVFFDPDKDTPTPLDPEADVVAAMKKTGMHPAIIYAYQKTGLLIAGDKVDRYRPEVVAEWDAAMQEYFNKSKPGASEPVDRRLWNTEIPELLADPLTRADHEQVLGSIAAIAPIQAQGMTTRARMELAAALLADTCSAAYRSAEAQGAAEQGPARYEAFEQLTLRRARELYAQGRA